MPLFPIQYDDLVRTALREDLASGDLTTSFLIPPHWTAVAGFYAKEPGCAAGLDVAAHTFRVLDPSVEWKALMFDGRSFDKGALMAEARGRLQTLLSGERTALNFLQHLCGIATRTSLLVEKLKGTRAVLLDTRKTLPGLRLLEKEAVRAGGGQNHRFSLGHAVMVKDNHLNAIGYDWERLKALKNALPPLIAMEVEVDDLSQIEPALEAGATMILLDNMTPEDLEQAVRITRGRARLEASGGITEETIAKVAASGVDYISVGALTHSARGLDIHMEIRGEC